MGHVNVQSLASDGYLRSSAVDYSVARAGTNLVELFTGGNELQFGQTFTGTPGTGTNYLTETFQEFTLVPLTVNEICTSASYQFLGFRRIMNGDPWTCEVREKDWGGTLEAADWISGDNLGSNPLMAEFPLIRTANPMPYEFRSGSAALRTRMSGASALRLVLSSNKTRIGFTPDGTHDEYQSVDSFENALDGAHRPRLDYSSTTKSSLAYGGGASVQLSDGSHAYLETDFTTGTVVRLKHCTLAGVVTTIESLPFGTETFQFAVGPGAQSFGLSRDSSDNLYIVGASGASTNGICFKGYRKGSGYNWLFSTGLGSAISYALPAYDQPINNCALTWHTFNGSPDKLVAVVAHTQGNSMVNQMLALSLSTEVILSGTGSPVIAIGGFPTYTSTSPLNTTGNALDIMSLNGGAGIVASLASDYTLAEIQSGFMVFKYTINSSGAFTTQPTDDVRTVFNDFENGVSDGDLTVQIMPVPGSQNRFYTRCGSVVCSLTYDGTSVFFLGRYDLFRANIPSLTGHNSYQPFTSVYDPSTNKVWVFYVDSANPRRVMRTAVNGATMLSTGEEVEVVNNVDVSGSVITRLRSPRGVIDERMVQLHIGVRSAAGAHSTVVNNYTAFNLFPNQPVLTNPGSFTAENSKTLSWAFTDPNPKDKQSAFQLQIRRADTLAVVLDTGKIVSTQSSYALAASTLSNSQAYQWEVRVYDTEDNVSLYSAWQSFSTVTTGIVLITDPPADNQLGLSSPNLTITWSFTITSPLTQSKYRVRVIRTDTNAVIFNSGYITAPDARSYQIEGLISDVQQRIELIVQDSSGAFSNTYVRLVTPSFSAPNVPSFLATPGEGGIIVTVVNPVPTGALPPAARNDIYRAESGSTAFIKVGEIAPNSPFTDYTAAAGTLYDYKVAAVAQGKTFSSTVAVGVSVDFYGVYIHIPNNPSTVRQFMFGGTSNSDQVTSASTEMKFVGRTYPVYEFGETLSESVDVELTIPNEDDNSHMDEIEYVRNVVRSRALHCYRDSRGRKVFGVVTSTGVKNIPGATTVSLTVKRSDYTEELP